MIRRAAAIGLALGLWAAAAPAQAAEDPGVVADLKIAYFLGDPPEPDFVGSVLSGLGHFYIGVPIPGGVRFAMTGPPIDIGRVGVGHSFSTRFTPGDACVGDGSCQLYFSFGGQAAGFPAFAICPCGVPAETPPPDPDKIALGVFGGAPIRSFGPIIAYDAPVKVGVWSVTLHGAAVPEPATWGLMLLGFAGAGVALRRSGRRGVSEA